MGWGLTLQMGCAPTSVRRGAIRQLSLLVFCMTDNSRVRVSIVGVVIVALFSALVARLWFLQMGPESNLKAEAVSRRAAATADAVAAGLDSRPQRCGARAGPRRVGDHRRPHLTKTVHQRVLGSALRSARGQAGGAGGRVSPHGPDPIAARAAGRRVGRSAGSAARNSPTPRRLPGRRVTQLTVRDYPEARKLNDPELAAQVLGYVGEIDADA